MLDKRLTKSVAGIAAIVLLLTALIGGDLAWSYWQGVQGVVRQELRDATSIEFDLARLDQAIEALTPTLRKNKKTAAELDVEIEFLQADTTEMEQQQADAKAEMQELRNALKIGESEQILIDGQEYSQVEVEDDLARRLRTYQQTQKQLETRQRILAQRREMLAKAISSIRDNEQQQSALAQQADALNAELRLLEVATATNQFQFDKPELANARGLATEIEKRIRTLQQLNEQSEMEHKIPVNLDRRTAAERFDELFGTEGK